MTHEDEDTVHIVFEGMDPSLIVAHCFIEMKRPQSIGVIVEIAYHAGHPGGRWLSGGVARRCIVTGLYIVTCMVPTC